jgi:hypothetical protein
MIIVALTSAATAVDVKAKAAHAASIAVFNLVNFILRILPLDVQSGRKTHVSAGGLRPKIAPAEIFLLYPSFPSELPH